MCQYLKKVTGYPAAVAWDYDDETLEFYPQPTKLKIVWRTAAGRTHSFLSTPDFFRITTTGFEIVECKLEAALMELALEHPTRYSVDSDGKWRSPPAEAAAALLGCTFVLRSSSENNWILVENLEFLRDYMIQTPEIDPAELEVLHQRLISKSWCSIAELLDDEPRVKPDVLYAAICQNEVYFDQTRYRLTEMQSSGVFRNRDMAAAYSLFVNSKAESKFADAELSLLPGSEFEWDGQIWEVLNTGDKSIAARRVPKASGVGVRPLGIPTVADRIAQTVGKNYLEPILEAVFDEDSYGYRPHRSATDTIAMARTRCWRNDWVLEFDIRAFFDNLNHDLLRRAIRHHTDCKWLLLYVERWLTAPVQLEDGS